MYLTTSSHIEMHSTPSSPPFSPRTPDSRRCIRMQPPPPYRPPNMFTIENETTTDGSVSYRRRPYRPPNVVHMSRSNEENDEDPFFFTHPRALLFDEVGEQVSEDSEEDDEQVVPICTALSTIKQNGIALHKCDPNDDTQCSICLDSDINSDNGGKLACGHAFHSKCIIPWLLGEKTSCPNCRQHIIVENLVKI